MDPNSNELYEKDDIQDVQIDDLILHKHKNLEISVEEKGKKHWEENWLPLHNKNSVILTESPVEAQSLGKDGGSSEEEQEETTDFREEQNPFLDADATSLNTWENILSDLRKLRNFTECEDLSPTELDLLEKGCFMLYKVKVPSLSVLITATMNAECTLCFVKYEGDITMYLLFEEETIEVTFLERIWVCRNGTRVSFYLGDRLITYIADFENVENAMEFELYFMFIAEFADKCTVVRLHGESAVKQLIFKGFTGETKSVTSEENTNHRFVEHLNETAKSHGPFSSKLCKNSFDDPMENIRRRMLNYLKYAYNLNVFLFKSCISFDIESVSKPYKILRELLLDFLTFARTVAFCVMPENPSTDATQSKSFSELEKDLFSLFDNVVCCVMLCRVLATYFQYRQQFIHIANTVCDNIFCSHNATNGSNHLDICCGHGADKNSNCRFSVVTNMYSYFYVCQDSPSFPEKFKNLDKVLRVGNKSTFDDLDKKFKTEFFEALSFSKTFVGVNKEFFGDRNSGIERQILFRHDADNTVSLSDLPEEFHSRTIYDSDTLGAGEDFVCQFVVQCVALLKNLSHRIEKHMCNFDLNEWLTLVEIWSAIDPKTTHFNLSDDDPAGSSQETRNETHVRFGSCNNSFSFPSSWNKYHNFERSEFIEVGHLGKGAYGSAEILKHDNLRKVVLKKYNVDTTDEDIKREITMLIGLQDNPHIINLVGFYYNCEEDFGLLPIGILLEYIHRNLYSFIHQRTERGFKHRYRYKTAIEQMRGMASAFAAMHKQRIMHRDIKPENILLTYDDKIQVCDLGMCGSIDKSQKTNICVGTLRYNSPEILEESSDYNEKTDVFSLGVMWEQVNRRNPYWKMKLNREITDFVCDGNRMDICDECPPALKEIIQSAWAQNPCDRPSMEELEKMLGDILSNLPDKTLNEDVLGPFRKIVRDGEVFYFEKIEYTPNAPLAAGVYIPENAEDLDSFVRNGVAIPLEISESDED